IIRIYIERHDIGESTREEIVKRLRSVLWKMKKRDQLSQDRKTGKYRLMMESIQDKEKPP
ncbi:MAG: hypothetical protein ACREA0_13490, partial [bacterium]